MGNNYVSADIPSLAGGRSLKELKNLEWIFIGIHALGVPVAVIMARLHDPASVTNVDIMAGILALWSIIACFFNYRIDTLSRQKKLAVIAQAIIAILTWVFIFQFVSGEHTAAYGVFAIVIVECAFRFGLVGSLIMGVVSVLGQAAAMLYRQWEYDLDFNVEGFLFWSVLFCLIALAVGLVTEETRRERRKNEILIRERTLLEERQRIARDLHDSVLKTLHGLAMEAHALRKRVSSPDVLGKVEYIKEICQRSSQEIRDIISELRREEENVGIASTISQMVEAWSKVTGVKTEFTVSGDERNLSLIATYNIRNVISEALLNIQKHANAAHVGVSLELLPGELRIEIVDNGKGIGYSGNDIYGVAAKGHYGIIGMKERIEQLNGQFSIDSSTGTRLMISIPLVKGK